MRPSEIYSKTVSVRLPMDKYIELLETATNMNLSVSEYITLRLFSKKECKQETKNVNKTTEKKEIKWKEVERFSNREKFNNENRAEKYNFNKIDIARSNKNETISKCGNFKIISEKKGQNIIYSIIK